MAKKKNSFTIPYEWHIDTIKLSISDIEQTMYCDECEDGVGTVTISKHEIFNEFSHGLDQLLKEMEIDIRVDIAGGEPFDSVIEKFYKGLRNLRLQLGIIQAG